MDYLTERKKFDKKIKETFESLDYETRLEVTSYIFQKITEHMSGGSFRYLIYNRLGFDKDAYIPLYISGGIEISNAFSILNDFDEKHYLKEE